MARSELRKGRTMTLWFGGIIAARPVPPMPRTDVRNPSTLVQNQVGPKPKKVAAGNAVRAMARAGGACHAQRHGLRALLSIEPRTRRIGMAPSKRQLLAEVAKSGRADPPWVESF